MNLLESQGIELKTKMHKTDKTDSKGNIMNEMESNSYFLLKPYILLTKHHKFPPHYTLTKSHELSNILNTQT